MVLNVNRNGSIIEVVLHQDRSPQDLLEALVSRTRLTRFEVRQPTLAEIFIHLVGRCDA